MPNYPITRRLAPLLFLFTILIVARPAATIAQCHGNARCGCHVQCPQCRSYCKLEIDKDKEEKSCWTVECETICIPPVTFPWQCTPKKCAKTKTIRILKKHKYECDVCSYTWTLVEPPCAQHGQPCAESPEDGAPEKEPSAVPPASETPPSPEAQPAPVPLNPPLAPLPDTQAFQGTKRGAERATDRRSAAGRFSRPWPSRAQ